MRIPVILVTEEVDDLHGKVLKGSCRSVDGVNIFNVLKAVSKYLLQFGGHPMAAGLTLHVNAFDDFSDMAREHITMLGKRTYHHNKIDSCLSIEKAIDPVFLEHYRLLEPFGPNNETPSFFARKAIIQNVRRIGKNGDHLSLTARGRFENTKCVGFGLGEHDKHMYERPNCSLVYSLTVNRFRKKTTWQPRIIDIL